MAQKFAKDRFDAHGHGLDRVGAHRAPSKKGRRWVSFWWALGATLALIAIGVVIIFALNSRLNFTIPGLPSTSASPAPTSTEVPTAAPTVDPALSVTVLNGSANNGVAASVQSTLEGAGWVVGAVGNSSSDAQPTTTVYYGDASLEGAARGVAASLTGAAILLSTDFAESGADLTVVVGNDYVIPAT